MAISSASQDSQAPAHARVSQTTLLALIWALTAVSAIFLIARLLIRIKMFKRLGLDDSLAILAWGILLAFAITWQIKASILYWQFDIVTGKRPYTPEFYSAYATFIPFIVVWNMLFYCCLWSVKFSFLVFFRGLDSKLCLHRQWWWVVFFFTWAGLAASIGDIDYSCSLKSIAYIFATCGNPSSVRYGNRTLYANMAADIFTDILILSIPIMILWKVQIKLRRKLILFAIFSATVVIMIIAIVRAALVRSHQKQTASIDWLYLWSSVEMGVAIMVSCVASFRQLFVGQNNEHLYGTRSFPSVKLNFISHLRNVARQGSTSRSSSQSKEQEEDMSEDITHPEQAKNRARMYQVRAHESV